MSRQKVEVKSSQTQAKPRQHSPGPGRVFKSRTSTSLTQAQIRPRRRSQQKGGAHQPVVQGSSGDVTVDSATVTNTSGCSKSDRSEQTFKRAATGPVGKVAGRRSNHSLIPPIRVKSLRLLRNCKKPLNQTPPPSSILPSSLRPCTHPPSSSTRSSSPPSSSAPQSGEHNTARTALINELSSRHQSSVPFRNVRESKLI
ncbi:uncharacterized protein si:ch211-266k8.4 [Scomber scombrus]|nr:uncharacterized protein si:ch211-266k8.4 [Scomber scombrus]